MNKDIKFFNRMLQVAYYAGFRSINSFALQGLGYASSEKLNRLKRPGNSPSYDILCDIIRRFPEVNANWLLVGEGEMLNAAAETAINEIGGWNKKASAEIKRWAATELKTFLNEELLKSMRETLKEQIVEIEKEQKILHEKTELLSARITAHKADVKNNALEEANLRPQE